MMCTGVPVMQPTDETVRLIWEGAIDADRMCRYYGYLSGRLTRLGEMVAIGTVGFSGGAVLAVLNHLPDWMSVVAVAVASVAGVALIIGRFQEKAARSVDLYRQIARLSTDWEELWSSVYERDEQELREAWRRLSRQQEAILERAPAEVPLWEGLALRCQREADEYWAQRYASA